MGVLAVGEDGGNGSFVVGFFCLTCLSPTNM